MRWGDGEQTRSFLFIDGVSKLTRRLMDSDFMGPVNIGSEEMVTINKLVDTAAKVANKEVRRFTSTDPQVFVVVTPTTISFVRSWVGTILRHWKRESVKHMNGLKNKYH